MVKSEVSFLQDRGTGRFIRGLHRVKKSVVGRSRDVGFVRGRAMRMSMFRGTCTQHGVFTPCEREPLYALSVESESVAGWVKTNPLPGTPVRPDARSVFCEDEDKVQLCRNFLKSRRLRVV